jgi:hypothetical protein
VDGELDEDMETCTNGQERSVCCVVLAQHLHAACLTSEDSFIIIHVTAAAAIVRTKKEERERVVRE